jgi:site-specific DNA-methyltransferase (adenine-specific)
VTAKNQLYYGDNYEVLQRYIKDESVDLIYLDPPFNSRQDYNVLFAEKDGSQSSSQIHAFEDTWEWNIDAQRSLEHIIERGGRVADAMRAFHTFLGGSDMMAYLAMMAPRLVELRRVLKETGSISMSGKIMRAAAGCSMCRFCNRGPSTPPLPKLSDRRRGCAAGR